MIKRSLSFVLLGCLGASSALASPLTIRRLPSGSDYPILSSTGIVAGRLSDGYPFLMEQSGPAVRIAPYEYEPLQMNRNGDLVGRKSTGSYPTYQAFMFFAPRGGDSLLVTSIDGYDGEWQPEIALNDSQQVAVLTTSSLKFFGFSGSSMMLTHEVVPGQNESFSPDPGLLLLPDNRAVVQLVVAGTPRWTLISPSGERTTISQDAIPGDTRLVGRTSPGTTIQISWDGTLYKTDLTSPATPVEPAGRKNRGRFSVWAASEAGDTVGASKVARQLNRSDGSFDDVFVSRSGRVVPVSCALPNRSRNKVSGLSRVSSEGSAIGTLVGTSDLAVIRGLDTVRTKKSYCARVSMSVVGSCRELFSGLSLKSSVTKPRSCQMEVRVRDASGKAVRGAQVVTVSDGDSSSIAPRGRTDTNGRVRFSFKVGAEGSYSMEVLAPYNHPELLGRAGQVSLR